MEKKKISTGIAICIMIIVTLLIVLGVTIYFGFIYKKDDTNVIQTPIPTTATTTSTTTTTTTTQAPTPTEKTNNTETKETKVVEGINYTVNVGGKERKIAIPQIINGGEKAVELNKKIASEILAKTYSMTEVGSGVIVSYDSKLVNNIVVIYATAVYDNWPASGNGTFTFNYFYDIEKDKELEMYEVLPLIGYTVSDIQKLGASSFNDFKDTSSNNSEPKYVNYLKIKDGKMEIIYHQVEN